ncbi:Transcription factor [Coemansia sp. RSA 1933]|nr:Transcription factor [Coemansia sp. RSA 1933]
MTTHKRRTSKLELEPNPFEQSFSRVRSSDNIAATLHEGHTKSLSSSPGIHKLKESLPSSDSTTEGATQQQKRTDGNSIATPPYVDALPSASSGSSTRSGQKITLPPVTAITTPMHASRISEAWGPESLRSGPLSPAMLGGPAADSSLYKPQARTTPRLGLTDPLLHTGLTPFMSGETHPMMAAGPLESSLAATPGLQAVIRATMDGHEIMATPGGSLRIAAKKNGLGRQQPPNKEFALSLIADADSSRGQPHELKRPAVDTPGGNVHIEPSAATPGALSRPPPSRAKRARSNKNGNEATVPGTTTNKRATAAARRAAKTKNSATITQAVPEDEVEGEDDDKRQQFLERNRVAALKCRQRKKRQLQELQDRHDYVVMENKRLHTEYMQLREQALQMRALLTAHRECPVANANGVFGTDSLPLGMSSLSLQQPLLLASGPESEHAKDIIAVIPPASNGVPVHSIDTLAGVSHPANMLPHH